MSVLAAPNVVKVAQETKSAAFFPAPLISDVWVASRFEKREVDIYDLFWLNLAQMALLKQFLPKSHGKPRVDNRRVLSGIIFINCNG